MGTGWTTGENGKRGGRASDLCNARSFLLQGTHNEVHGAELPTSKPAGAVPPRGQSVLHLHRAAQLGAGYKRVR